MLLSTIAKVHKHERVVLGRADDVKAGEAAKAVERILLVEVDGGMVIRDDVEVHPSTKVTARSVLCHFVDELGCCDQRGLKCEFGLGSIICVLPLTYA